MAPARDTDRLTDADLGIGALDAERHRVTTDSKPTAHEEHPEWPRWWETPLVIAGAVVVTWGVVLWVVLG